MVKSKGLRLSAIGAVIFLTGLAALTVLPTGLGVAGILIGGVMVWSGFLWTMAGYYLGQG